MLKKIKCRHCFNFLNSVVFDLGHQPLSNDYLSKTQLNSNELYIPLKLFHCKKCGLIQIPEYKKPEEVFKSTYAYLSSTSSTMNNHAKNYVNNTIKKIRLSQSSFVVELASNDGYLLKYFVKKNIPCLGVEPTELAAKIAIKQKINTIIKFFGYKTSKEIISQYGKAKLIIANNVLPHVPNINDFFKGIVTLLSDNGFVSIEFQHILTMIKKNYWDTIYHEHYNYLSLEFLMIAVKKFNLQIVDAEKISTHGGSLRIWIKHKNKKNLINLNAINKILYQERAITSNYKSLFQEMQNKALSVKLNLLKFLINSKKKNLSVIAYGAAAKGNTLLNYAGIDSDLISNVVDKSRSKHSLYLPGSKIFISKPEDIKFLKPDIILLLPWNIKNEILKELKQYKNIKFYVAIPKLKRIFP